jgi:EAL domain-containing protein (putative c-di-GMP-specific phosphodiesterase class I)
VPSLERSVPSSQATTLDHHHLPAGARLFSAGDVGDAAYLIVSGRLEIVLERPEGDLILAHRGPGEIVGEMAILDHQPRSAAVRALEDSELVVITEEQLSHRIAQTDPILRMCLGVVLARYRQTVAILEQMKGTAPPPVLGADTPPSETFAAALGALSLEREIRAGLRNGEFELFFQPIVRLSSRRLAGFEALMRWRHPTRGLVPPIEFIPAAEASGLIIDLTAHAFAEVGRVFPELILAAQTNPGALDGPLFMTVNVSGRDLAGASFPEMIADFLARTQIAPSSLKIEVTESMLMDNPERAAATLMQCRKAGLGIAIDDFGTGYSSLSYLSTLPVTTLKIDRAFVRTLLADQTSRGIVQTILRLADDLAVSVVAEGIEQAAEADLLAGMGCAFGQGYHFGRPAPLAGAVQAIRTWPAPEPERPGLRLIA